MSRPRETENADVTEEPNVSQTASQQLFEVRAELCLHSSPGTDRDVATPEERQLVGRLMATAGQAPGARFCASVGGSRAGVVFLIETPDEGHAARTLVSLLTALERLIAEGTATVTMMPAGDAD